MGVGNSNSQDSNATTIKDKPTNKIENPHHDTEKAITGRDKTEDEEISTEETIEEDSFYNTTVKKTSKLNNPDNKVDYSLCHKRKLVGLAVTVNGSTVDSNIRNNYNFSGMILHKHPKEDLG